jgi:hypothetical protein
MFKRVHAPPKITVRCLKQGNPPAWCIQWPTWTSNPSTPVFFEDPAGAGRCMKLTVATPLTTQRTMKGRQAPPFTASCNARIMHVLSDPRMLFMLWLILTPRDRHVLDEQAVEPWADHVAPHYNDLSFCPEAQALLFNGVGRGDADGVDPPNFIMRGRATCSIQSSRSFDPLILARSLISSFRVSMKRTRSRASRTETWR